MFPCDVSLKCSIRVGTRVGDTSWLEKKAKQLLELPLDLTQLNISARWWRAGEMEMHTNRVVPSMQHCATPRTNLFPNGHRVKLHSWRPSGQLFRKLRALKEKVTALQLSCRFSGLIPSCVSYPSSNKIKCF